MVAMLMIFVEFGAAISEGGLTQALIKKGSVTSADATAVVAYNLVTSGVIYGLIWLAAPWIAGFYAMPALETLVRVISLNIPLRALASVNVASLTSAMNFKPQALAGFISTLLAGVAGIWMARAGRGVMSIVVYQVGTIALQTALLWILARRVRFGRPSGESFKSLFRFGSPLLVSSLIDVAYRNMYLPVIGKLYDARELGFFTRARQFASFPSVSAGEVVRSVSYSALCRKEGDRKGVFLRMIRLTAFVSMPVMLYVAFFSRPLVVALVGEKWVEAASMLPYMSGGVMFLPLSVLNLQLIQAEGRSDYYLKSEIWKKGVGVALMLAAVAFGVWALALAWAATSLIGAMINAIYSRKCSGIKVSEQIQAISGIFFLSLGCCIAGRGVSLLAEGDVMQLATGFGVSALLYAFPVVKVIKRIRKEI